MTRTRSCVTQLGVLAGVLQIMLIDKVREELGDSYGASVGSQLSDTFPDFGVLNASAVVAPDKIDEVRAAIDEAVAQLRSAPISADLLARARNSKLESADRMPRENGAWTGLVARAQTDPARLDRLLGLRARIAAVTPAQLQALAVKYLAPQARLEAQDRRRPGAGGGGRGEVRRIVSVKRRRLRPAATGAAASRGSA